MRLAPRPVFLAGRENLLAELDARLGGAGKTSVAIEYAHRHLAERSEPRQHPLSVDQACGELGLLALALDV